MNENRIPISVFIIAHNEADRIGRTISSVIDWVDEVVVVDSGSSDETVAIAISLGARVLHRDWEGYGPQKVFAESQCRHDWILAIDADEPLSDKLQSEIQHLFSSGEITKADYYWIDVVSIYPFERKPAPWAFRIGRITLYDRKKSGFSTSIVHDRVIPGEGAREGYLEGIILHHSHKSLSFQVSKLNSYTDLQAKDVLAKGRKISALRLLIEFPLAFLKAYFFRRYLFYGLWGVIISVSHAHQRFLRLAKIYEARQIEKFQQREE